MERVAGIEPAYSAWKADVLPLNYTRGTNLTRYKETSSACRRAMIKPAHANKPIIKHYRRQLPSRQATLTGFNKLVVGGGFEPPKLSRQIYSLIPLATREPHQKERDILLAQTVDVNRNMAFFWEVKLVFCEQHASGAEHASNSLFDQVTRH